MFYAQHVLSVPNANLKKDIIGAVKLDRGLETYQTDMWQGKGSHLA